MTKLEQLKVAFQFAPCVMSDENSDLVTVEEYRFYELAHNMMPLLLEAVTALKWLQELALEMGHEIRALDENSNLLGYWTNDGEYIRTQQGLKRILLRC